MFNSVKKAINRVFGRPAVKPHRNVIALPTVDTAAESEEALVDARIDFLALLERIIEGKKDAEEEAIDSILDLLHEGFYDGEYRTAELNNKLFALLRCDVLIFDNDGWSALAAAIEYFAGCFPVGVQDIEHALKVIERGDYRYIAETPEDYAGHTFRVEDDETLGMVIANEKIDCGYDSWEYLEAYFDFEACGRDYRTATNGRFTTYGFFAEC